SHLQITDIVNHSKLKEAFCRMVPRSPGRSGKTVERAYLVDAGPTGDDQLTFRLLGRFGDRLMRRGFSVTADVLSLGPGVQIARVIELTPGLADFRLLPERADGHADIGPQGGQAGQLRVQPGVFGPQRIEVQLQDERHKRAI